MTDIERELEKRNLCYSEADYWHNDIIGKEIVRFKWGKFKEHYKTVKGIKHFDDVIMKELRSLAEIRSKNGVFDKDIKLSEG